MTERPEDKIKLKLQETSYGLQQRLEGAGRAKIGGLCGSCAQLRYKASRYGSEEAYCRAFEKPISPGDPVVVCSEYWPKGHPTLEALIEKATLITIKHYDNEGLYL